MQIARKQSHRLGRNFLGRPRRWQKDLLYILKSVHPDPEPDFSKSGFFRKNPDFGIPAGRIRINFLKKNPLGIPDMYLDHKTSKFEGAVAKKKPLHFREIQWGINHTSSLKCNGFFGPKSQILYYICNKVTHYILLPDRQVHKIIWWIIIDR